MRGTRRAALASAAAALASQTIAFGASAETLADALKLAYESNPTLMAARAQLRATDEEYVQARAGYRPTVTAGASYTYDNNRASVPPVSSTSTGAITVTQPLYTGGRVATQIDAAKADILAQRQALRQSEIGLMQHVVQVYVDVRRDQEQLTILSDAQAALAQLLDQTNSEFAAGDVTRTDIDQSRMRLAQARAQVAAAQAQLAGARAAYAAVVGQAPGELAPEPPIAQLLPATVEAAFDTAEQNNPQLLQSIYTEEASAARLAQAKAQGRPTIGLTGSYGYNGGGGTIVDGFFVGPGNRGPFSDYLRDFSVTANASIPLFTGGLNASQVRQAAEQANVSRIDVETVRRQTDQAVAQAWSDLLGARASLVADEEQVKAASSAFDGMHMEQEAGLRSVIELLNARQDLETAQLALLAARHDEYVAAAAVLAADGSLEAKDLVTNEPTYDPKANFDRVSHAWGWVPWESAIDVLDHIGAPVPQPPPMSRDAPPSGNH